MAGKEDSEIHHTIAELMILANSAVAEQIERAFPSAALVRVHAAPDPSRLTTFEGVAAKVGVHRKGATEVKTGAGGGGAAEGERGDGWLAGWADRWIDGSMDARIEV